MLAAFSDFLRENPNCSNFEHDAAAQNVFAFLAEEEHVLQLVEAAASGKPALSGCVAELEDYCAKNGIDLTNDYFRTVVGRMVKTILAPFGYLPTVNRRLPKGSCGQFSTASCYEKKGPATLQVVKRIERVG